MTRRERMERRAEKRRDWAGSAAKESDRRLNAAHQIAHNIPFGQPVLVGHHSEKHHRRDLARIDSNMSKGVEAGKRSDHHEAVADTLEQRLETNIFSDDHNAVEALEARIAERTAQVERLVELNKAMRKELKAGDGWLDRIGATDNEKRAIARNVEFGWDHKPFFPSYAMSNKRNLIRADQERIKSIKAQAIRTAEAEAAGGVVIKVHEHYASVTFAEKPEYHVITTLKEAGFHWSGGSWHGQSDKIPEKVKALAPPGREGEGTRDHE